MAADTKQERSPGANDQAQEPYAGQPDRLVPAPDDPGGSHRKGYTADPDPGAPVPEEGPVPLAEGSEGVIHQPEWEGRVQPTGRKEPTGYSPNDRLMGSDR